MKYLSTFFPDATTTSAKEKSPVWILDTSRPEDTFLRAGRSRQPGMSIFLISGWLVACDPGLGPDGKRIKSNLINFLAKETNDLEKSAVILFPRIKKVLNIIKAQKGCYISRITGSGSACVGIFSNMMNAYLAQKMLKLKFPKYWCVVSKTI